MTQNSIPFQQAVQLLRSGETLAAEDTMQSHVQAVRSQYGDVSGEHAVALHELASILHGMDRTDDAVQTLKMAVEIQVPDDEQVTRNRLTFLMELGSLYSQTQRLDEAEDTLRQSLELREAFYGQQHAGYAFGLEPLAVLKMRAEQWQEARELIEQTIDIFWADGHPRIASAFPYRAWILKQLNDPQPAFDGLEDVPDEIIADMIQQLGQLLNQQQAACSQAVIDDLIKALEQRYPAEHNFLLQLQGFQAMVQRWIGPSEGRVESLEKLSQALLDQQRLPEAVDALIGLAEAFDALHDRQSAETTFHRALHYAHQSEDPRLVSTASRNFGLFYDQSLGSEEAEIYLRQAVEAAEATDDIQLLGTGLIALGIYLQHKAQTEEAEQHLERGLRLLPPADFNYICGSSHLQAIQSGGSCGCGDTTEAYLAALRNHILETVPEGLINDAKVSQGDDGQIQVELDFDHELDEQESEQVRRAMQQAHLDFQRKMKGES